VSLGSLTRQQVISEKRYRLYLSIWNRIERSK